MGFFKSQGAKVKLMVCKKTQSKMHKNAWKQKLFLKCKTNNFSMKDFFSFSNLLRFHAVNKRTFAQICELLILDMHCKNLCKKTSFLATDATTQSSNQEENETRNCFFYFIAK
jgi:hypothetical protein